MLLGPSGCGKTTTLRMIAGLELPTSGEILIDGEEVSQIPASGRDIAFVFQMFALYPHMNVRRNIAYPLVSQGMRRGDPREDRRDRGAARHHRDPRPPRRRALRRGPPARRARPRHRARAQGLHDGRAPRRARRRVPRDHGRGAARAPRPDGLDHGLCHPRPARGHADGRQDRRHEPRGRRAVRPAAGDLRPPRLAVRGGFHRLAPHECAAAGRRASRRGPPPSPLPGPRSPCRRSAKAPPAGSPSASAPSMSASPRTARSAPALPPPSISAPPRSSRSRPRPAP